MSKVPQGKQEGLHMATQSTLSETASTVAIKSIPEVSCCGWPLDDDGFCHGCWEHCL